MKTLKRLGFTAFTALALVLTACSGSDDDGGSSSSLDTYINAKVDGVQFTTTSFNGVSAGVATKSGTGDMQLITIACTNATSAASQDYESIDIALVGPITAGTTYQVNSSTNTTLGYVVSTPTNTSWDTGDCDGATGTITITAITATKVEGTFSFTGAKDDDCSSHKTVTNGEFRGTFMN